MYELSFELKGLPKMSNSNLRGHWHVKYGASKTWKRAVWRACWHLRPPLPLKRAHLTLTRCSSSEPDFDGLVSGFKHVIDGLVEAGVLENDKPSNIGTPDCKWIKTAPRKGKIIINVKEIADGEKETNA
jgi:hypothetical protein